MPSQAQAYTTPAGADAHYHFYYPYLLVHDDRWHLGPTVVWPHQMPPWSATQAAASHGDLRPMYSPLDARLVDVVPVQAPEAASVPSRAPRGTNNRKMESINLEDRVNLLSEDAYTTDVTMDGYYCTSCETRINLDLRKKYAQATWVLHRKLCIRERQCEYMAALRADFEKTLENRVAQEAVEEDHPMTRESPESDLNEIVRGLLRSPSYVHNMLQQHTDELMGESEDVALENAGRDVQIERSPTPRLVPVFSWPEEFDDDDLHD
ncbi:hypothetical protein CONPUDRAFT_149384 [Coniophora puteana RWD-64-598 SS2]|uniref:Uncharacterized protein n=1 Tax=Coniophora puteana (strain RWD-64-598) TaxID=741705 RepID=A0A5M3N8B7_CONPW|nr:uncharacterized protein CONPUDRAFT_149384 [Coniophora puteana RWD-64-598 SS2]EIW87354.1 hypothetical protein CONPUDRAFT_149384 [Coniophora puteana RWD-64-598 SS2]